MGKHDRLSRDQKRKAKSKTCAALLQARTTHLHGREV